MFVAVGSKLAGFLGVADTIKESVREAIEELHKQKIEIVMMTGDNQITAEAVAKKLGIKQIFADVLPEQKAEKIKQLQAQGKSWRWPAMGLTMRPHWHKQMLESRWERERTWQSNRLI